jgi:hypothetical protein
MHAIFLTSWETSLLEDGIMGRILTLMLVVWVLER